MTAYRIKYQIRRKGVTRKTHIMSGRPWSTDGEWQDKEKVIVVGEDAREAIDEIVSTLSNNDFRVRGVEIITDVDIIAHGLSAKINPTDQGCQNTIG